MWAFQYQPLLNSLLQKALVELCTQSLPWEGRLEIDGIFCVSGKDPSQQIVIKIHKALEKPEPKKSVSKADRNNPGSGKKVVIEDGKIVSSSQHKQPKKSPSMPLNLSLQALKSGGSVIQNSTTSAQQKAGGVGSQSLRALLGTKPMGVEQDGSSPGQDGDGKTKPTILRQPHAPWLRKEADGDTGSETGSERRELQDYFTDIKEEPLDMADSESSVDMEEYQLTATNVTCKICNISYENFTTLQAHTLQMHKRYACRQCCNTFSLRCNLRRHERLHAGVKPHACKFCKKTFSRTADLRAHIRKHSEDTTDLISCSKCPKSFRTAVNLRLHMYKVHKEKDCVYACNICEKVFHDAEEFQAHRDGHRASLLQAGLKDNESSCSTPLLNGSQDSMDEDMDQTTHSETDNLDKEMDLSVHSTSKQQSFLQAMASRAAAAEMYDGMDSPSRQFLEDSSHHGSPNMSRSVQGQEEDGQDIGLYFGSPLVIKEENDSQDSENMKRSNRRKSRPSKVTAQSAAADIEDDTENLEPPVSNPTSPDVTPDTDSVLNGETMKSMKREAQDDWTASDFVSHDAKRPRIQTDNLLDNFTMANQSLEDIMKQVNENLYKNKDVMIAEENEKDAESKDKKGKAKPKVKKLPAIRQPVTKIPPLQPRPAAPAVTSKPPLVLLVTGTGTMPKIALPPASETPSPLRVSIKKDTNATWSVSPKNKKEHDVCLSPILPHNLSLSGNPDVQTYTCSQWGCTFSCVGFSGFEDHTLASHGRYPCKFCSQTFTGRNNRTRHIRYHITGKQHQCNECGKYFARPDSLKEHRFIHTKSYRDSICVNCQVAFEKKASLLSHMKKCFSDEQLETDKVPYEEIEKDKDAKRVVSTPKAKEPSDIGVMKAEYIKKETEKILNVKKYLDHVINIAPIPEGADDPTAPTLSPQAPDQPLPQLQLASPAGNHDNTAASTSLPVLQLAPSLAKSESQPLDLQAGPPTLQPAPSSLTKLEEEFGQDSEVPEGVDNSEMGALSPGGVTTADDDVESSGSDQPMVIDEEEDVTVIDLDMKKQLALAQQREATESEPVTDDSQSAADMVVQAATDDDSQSAVDTEG